jgi:uncharacterized membrane protein
MLLALASAARVWTLGDKNIWLDEAASWTEATSPVERMLGSVAGDVHPPLYYLMLKGWVAMAGDSAIAMRSPSVVFGVLIVLLCWLLAGRWLTGPVRTMTVLWLALSPHLIFFAQEARMYAPATAAVLTAALAYRRWTESRFASRRALTAFTAAMVVALYLHYFTALFLAALWIHLIVIRREPPWREWSLAHAAMILAYLPWLSVAADQFSRGQPWRQPLTLLEYPVQLFVLLAEFSAGFHLRWTWAIAIAFLVIAVVVIRGWLGLLSVTATERREQDIFLALACGVPVIVSLAALPVTGHMTLSRYLAFVVPLLILGVGRGLIAVGSRRANAVALLGGATIASAICLASYYRDPFRDFDVRPVVRAVETEASARPDGVVLLEPAFIDMCIKYYSRQPPVRYQRIPPGTDIWHALTDAARHGRGPLWLVVTRNSLTFDAEGVPDGWRLEEIALEPSRPDRIRMMRVFKTR